MKWQAAIILLLLVLVCGCKRERRQFQHADSGPSATATTMSELQPGAQTAPPEIKNPMEESAYDVSEGKRLFTWYNCSGCHANGGGGMGPALMDDRWIYGSQPQNIYSTIVEGRPNGMPSFRQKIPDHQVWQLSAYVRSLSGQLPKDVSPTRSDDMNAHKSEQASEEKKPAKVSVPNR